MKRQLAQIWMAIAVIVVVGCTSAPDSATDTGVPGLDAGRQDAGDSDSGRVTTDAGPRDAEADAGAVDGSVDSDDDGVPDDVDCAPSDPSIGRTASRDCATACGAGTEACTDGVWSACTAPTDCVCDSEGARRIVACGMCGEASEECTDGMWQSISFCLGQGECLLGAVETTTPTSFCQVDQRLCGADCAWDDWTVIVPRGDCRAGMRVCISLPPLDYICTDECQEVDDPDCPVNP